MGIKRGMWVVSTDPEVVMGSRAWDIGIVQTLGSRTCDVWWLVADTTYPEDNDAIREATHAEYEHAREKGIDR